MSASTFALVVSSLTFLGSSLIWVRRSSVTRFQPLVFICFLPSPPTPGPLVVFAAATECVQAYCSPRTPAIPHLFALLRARTRRVRVRWLKLPLPACARCQCRCPHTTPPVPDLSPRCFHPSVWFCGSSRIGPHKPPAPLRAPACEPSPPRPADVHSLQFPLFIDRHRGDLPDTARARRNREDGPHRFALCANHRRIKRCAHSGNTCTASAQGESAGAMRWFPSSLDS